MLRLNFYGAKVEIQSEWEEIISLLKKDFSSFLDIDSGTSEYKLNLKIERKNPLSVAIPKLISSMQSLNSITYQVKQARYNDYYGKLLSIFDYSSESAILYSENEHKTHEIAYLLILSRIGKRLDLEGLHKLHAFAISYKDVAFVCMMPMKGGKSTLLVELLKYDGVKMISDDIPLVNKFGEVLSFPIKLGLEADKKIDFHVENPTSNIYQIYREQYGIKTFISTLGIEDKVEKPGRRFSKIIIAEAYRFQSSQSEIKKSSLFKTMKGLFKHGVIGFGLPMILEYFWEFGALDFFRKACIFMKRLFSFLVFSIKSKKITISYGTNPAAAAQVIMKYLEGSHDKI